MQEIFFQLLGVSITTSIVIAIFMLLSPIINVRYKVKARYYIWIFIAIRLIIPVDFGITDPPMEIDIPNIGITYDDGEIKNAPLLSEGGDSVGMGPSVAKATSIQPIGKPNYFLTISQILALVYFAGVGLSLIAQFFLYLSFRRSTKRWYQKLESLQTIEAFRQLKGEMNLGKALDIRVCKKISSPMIIGLIKPTLLLPHDRYQGVDLELILKHELTHFIKNDLWFKLLLIAVSAIHWFNPMIHLMVREANKDIEMACDEEVLKGSPINIRERYTERILELMELSDTHSAPVSTSFRGGKDMMRHRMQSIFDMRRKKKGITIISILLIAIIIGSACKIQAMGNFSIPLTENTVSGYEDGLAFDLDRDGMEETKFLLKKGNAEESRFLVYQRDWRNLDRVQVFKNIALGADYNLQAGNMVDSNTINILVTMNHGSIPFQGGSWELYSWENGKFKNESLEPVKDNLKVQIPSIEAAKNNYLQADIIINLKNNNEYREGDPVLAFYFDSQWVRGDRPKSLYYAPLSQYDVGGYEKWKEKAVNKTMIGIRLVEGEVIEKLDTELAQYGTLKGKVFLETKEAIYISLPNPIVTVTSYYEYKNGEWNYITGEIQ